MILSLRMAAGLFAIYAPFTLGCHSQSAPASTSLAGRTRQTDASPDSTYRLTPTPDTAAPNKVYIPATLLDAFAELDRMLTVQFRSQFAADSSQAVLQHFNLGLWMRNNWDLWRGSRLSRFFNHIGVCHPDDMSGIILRSYWRYLHGRELQLEEQVRASQQYWRDQGVVQGCTTGQ
jgi:hypothetical protein